MKHRSTAKRARKLPNAARTGRQSALASVLLEDDDHIPLQDYVMVKLGQLGDTVHEAATAYFDKKFALRSTELWILAQLGRRPPLAVSELSRWTRIDKAWISRTADVLVRRGLVRKTPHPTDRRMTLLSLTRKGEATLAKTAPISRRRHERLLQGLDKKLVYSIIDALQQRADALAGDPES